MKFTSNAQDVPPAQTSRLIYPDDPEGRAPYASACSVLGAMANANNVWTGGVPWISRGSLTGPIEMASSEVNHLSPYASWSLRSSATGVGGSI